MAIWRTVLFWGGDLYESVVEGRDRFLNDKMGLRREHTGKDIFFRIIFLGDKVELRPALYERVC